MLRRKDRGKDQGSEPFTYIHQATTIKGELRAQGRVRVHGTVQGVVEIDGVLEVAEGGVVSGELIRAQEVKIIGSVTANIEAQGKVEIWSRGRLEGNVRAAALDIEEGASFIGRSEMRTEEAGVLSLAESVEVVEEPEG